jgi:HEPN domain-containing protein
MNRSGDWIRQADAELAQARHAVQGGYHALACFLCQQAAEKATKAVYEAERTETWGHAVSQLLRDLPSGIEAPEDAVEAARRLDHHYIPARYPNGFHSGIPDDYYTARESGEAIADAEAIVAFCKQHLP